MVELKVFKAAWCGPCKTLEPTLKELENDGHKISYIDVDENKEEAVNFGVRGVPTTIVLKDGKESTRLVGNKSKEEILESMGQ